jgi:predicted dehydrogenase
LIYSQTHLIRVNPAIQIPPMATSRSRAVPLKAGIIGTGFIGPVHLEALRRIGVVVSAVSDTPSRVREAAERWGVPEAYPATRYLDLIESPNVDVVHIAAPNRFHCEMSLAAISAGKACVCEKPLALNTAETARIVRESRRRGTVFAVNYNVRFYPAVLQLRALVSRGELGDLIHVNGSYFQDWLFKDTDYNWRLLPKEGGSLRAVADIGTHWLDTATFILGSPVRAVLADLQTFHKTRRRPLDEVRTFTQEVSGARYRRYPVQTEDFASVLLEFGSGARGNLAVSQVAAGRKNCLRIELYGSRRSAWWDSEEPNIIRFGNRDGANEVAIRNTPPFGPDVAGFTDYPAGHNEGFPDTFKMLFRSVYSAVRSAKGGCEQLHATAADGHREVAVCEAILKSHQQRAWQIVGQ